ncbi:hypothetical protein DSECCO2_423700 [anaerobic digester metagenome]
MDFEDPQPAFPVRRPHINKPVKAARTQDCGVKQVRAVSCGNNYHILECLKPVHFGEQLVEYPFRSPAVRGFHTLHTGNRVDLIKEDNTGRDLPRFLEGFTNCFFRFSKPL